MKSLMKSLMMFSFLVSLSSSAVLAAPAGSDLRDFMETMHSERPFDEGTDTLNLGSVSFQEAKAKLEKKLDANASDNTLDHICFKYKTCTDWLVDLAKAKDDRGFLVVLALRENYYYMLEAERGWIEYEELDNLGQHVQLAFLTAAEYEDKFMLDLLFRRGTLYFPKLVDWAIAERHDSMVDILLKDTRTHDGILQIWRRIKLGTKLPDVVGKHLFEYAVNEIGAFADDQATANDMFIEESYEKNYIRPLRFIALLAKTDGAAHKIALKLSKDISSTEVNCFVVATLLSYGELENFDFQSHNAEIEGTQN